MDEISLLRRVRDDIPERSPEAVTRGRAALFQAIEGASPLAGPNRSRRRRGVAWAGFSVLGAGALTVGLVAGNVLGAGVPGGPGGADAAAASALESAAIATLETSDPVVGPGQFLRVETDIESLFAAEEASYIEGSHYEIYLPAERSAEWVMVQCAPRAVQTFGAESERMASENVGLYTDSFDRVSGGEFFAGALDAETMNALPRDPDRLLKIMYAQSETPGLPREEAALLWIADLLRTGTAPADLQAAAYRAAIKIPGVTVTESQTTLNGTTGTAIGLIESSGQFRHDLIIDTKTGVFLGERNVALTDTLQGYDAGQTVFSTSVTTTVVDSAPTDTALCEGHR